VTAPFAAEKSAPDTAVSARVKNASVTGRALGLESSTAKIALVTPRSPSGTAASPIDTTGVGNTVVPAVPVLLASSLSSTSVAATATNRFVPAARFVTVTSIIAAAEGA